MDTDLRYHHYRLH